MNGIKHNGIVITIQKIPDRKLPALCVQFEDENDIIKVASFNNEKAAHWFAEVMEDFFDGLVK